MTCIQLTDKIGLEYDLYSVDYVYRIEHVFDLIGHSLTIANRDLEYLSLTKSINRRDGFFAKLFGRDALEYGYFRPEFYNQHNKLLDLHMRMIIEHRRRLNELFSILDEDNMRDVYKLGMFTVEKHLKNSVYMTGSRKLLEYGGPAYAYMTKTLPIDVQGFEVFFEKKVEEIKGKRNLQFSKK